MKNIVAHAHRHLKAHIVDHHQHYIFGIFGGFALFKLFLLVMSIGSIPYTLTHAQIPDNCTLTGQYYTGEYETGCYEVPEQTIGGYLIDCQTIPGYWTGGTTNESGEVVDQLRVEESQTGCVLTGQTIIPAYTTGCYMTGGYRTGGTVVCEIQGSGTNETGTVVLGNGICENGDILWSEPLSGSVVRDIFDIQRNYSGLDCLISGLSLQLRDHNQQWIDLSIFASGTTSYAFDSQKLYSFQHSGLYHIIGTNMSGNDYYLYTGQYTGSYSRLFTGYKLRLLTPDQTLLHETSPFTIDNGYPTLSGMTLMYSGVSTGYVPMSGLVTLSFVASELLDSVDVTLGGKSYSSSSYSGLVYIYTRVVNSLYPQGNLVSTITFNDVAGNTGSLIFTGGLIFDTVKPTVTGFVFTESAEGLLLSFVGSEPIQYTLNYRTSGSAYASGKNTHYLTAHQASLVGIERDQLYSFTLDLFDQAGNSRSVTGEVTWTSLGQIISNISIVSATGDQLLTGNLSTLAVTLKKEVEKFNACKDALGYSTVDVEVRRTHFIIQMPKFKKSQVKTLVNAFTLFVLDQIKSDYKITKTDIEKITEKFNSFLVILKLLRDDDNSCKQNLSNYHISQFQKALEEYNINLD